MVKLLGIIDLLAASLLLGASLKLAISVEALVIVPLFLFGKACIALGDVGSWIDLFVLALIVSTIFFVLPTWILYLGAALVGFKGLASLFA